MYKVNVEQKELTELKLIKFSELGLKERFDIQEWVEKTPSILGEELLIIAKEYILPSGTRLDLLAIDRLANLVIIELKRDDSGCAVDWQAIKYASYCSNFTAEDIYKIFADYMGSNDSDAEFKIEDFIEEEIENLNEKQRIILASKEYHSDVVSAVLWLRDFGVDIKCVKLEPFIDQNNSIFINKTIIIPLPEAKDYIQKRETKIKEKSVLRPSSFSMEKSSLPNEELKAKITETLSRSNSDLTHRVIVFLQILLEAGNEVERDAIKKELCERGIGDNIGHAGRLLSNISQFLTKKSNPHLRQIIEFKSGGGQGDVKNNYKLIGEYRELIKEVLKDPMVQSSMPNTVNA